jgi:O-antigen/teichoic acid export membrane protein
MSAVFGQLAKNSSIYGLSNILSRFIGFVMIPIYTRYLTPGDYGTMEMLDLTAYVVTMWVGFSVSSAIVRFYYDYENESERHQLVSTALLFVAATSFAAVACLLPFSSWISKLLFKNPANGHYFMLVFASIFFSLLIEDCLVFFQVRQKAIWFAGLSTARLALGLTLNIVFVVLLKKGVLGILLSGLTTSAIMGFFIFGKTLSMTGLGFSPAKLKKLVAYGFPLIFSGFSTFVITFSDRYFLNAYSTLDEVGNYSLGYKISMLISVLITNPFITAWSAKRFEIARQPGSDETNSRVFTYFVIVLAFGALGLCAYINDIIALAATPAFRAAAYVVPMVVLGYVLNAVYYHFNYGILLQKRTKVIAVIMATAAGLNLLMNYLLIPRLHSMGAAMATTLSYLYIAVTTLIVSQRLHPIRYEVRRVAFVALLAAVLFGVSRFITPHSLLVSVCAKTFVVVLFPATLYFARFFREEELAMARAALAKIRGNFPIAASWGKSQ